MERKEQQHNVAPVYDKDSRILVLGSFPSVKSRQAEFFYAHPQNRFWRVLAAIVGRKVPQTVEEKKRLLLDHRIALWDVIASCEIAGSSDASITDAKPNDLQRILDTAEIKVIFCNGGTAAKHYERVQKKILGREAITLPSTSPANAGYSLQRLTEIWREALLTYL